MSLPASVLALNAAVVGLEPLSFGQFLLGCVVLAFVIGVVGWAAQRVRRVAVPWIGAPARLVECVIGFSIITAVGLTLGALGWFSSWPLLIGIVGCSVVVGRTANRRGPLVPPPPLRDLWSSIGERMVAVLVLTIVGAQWLSHTAWALGHGMTEGDTLWYHGVFAARFVQEGRLDIFPHLGAAAQGYFPANSQMYHALAFLPFDRDLLSPLLNLVFAAVALLAAYCVGRRRGLGAVSVTACAVVLGLPAIVGTHPGQATTDLACAAFLLTAIALLLESDFEPVPVSLAAIAAALSLGTKLTVAVPLTALTIAVAAIAVHRRRSRVLVAWVIWLVVFGAYWFVRNWTLADNPLPWYDLQLGPLHLPARSHLADNAAITDFLFDRDVWSTVWFPGFRRAFGLAWPLLVVAPGVAGLLMFGTGRRTAERVAGVVAVAAGIGYLTTPFTMELGGAAFAATARYATPALLIGLVLVPLALCLDRAGLVVRFWVSILALLVVFVNASAVDIERFAPWRTDDAVLAVALVGIALLFVGIARVGGRPARIALVVPVAFALVFSGYAVQRNYLTHRYRAGTGLGLDGAYTYVGKREPTRIAPFDTVQFYPFFGPAFENIVLALDPPPLSPRSNEPTIRCREWEQTLRDAHPKFVVFGVPGSVPVEKPDRAWILASPSVTVVHRDGEKVVARVTEPLRFQCP